MICKSCKCQMPDNSRFCPQCGEKVIAGTVSSQSMQLICKSCGSVLSCDEDKPILFCPSCGSKELLAESDAVKIERMRTKAQRDIEINKQQTYREVELNRIKKQEEKEAAAQIEKKAAAYKKSKLYKWTIAFLVISAMSCASVISTHRFFQSVVAIAQVLCFGASLLTGLQIIMQKKHNLHILFVILGFVLYLPIAALAPKAPVRIQEPKTFVWPSTGMFSMIPAPATNEGEIHSNNDSYIWVEFNNISPEQYQGYYDECLAAGFTIEPVKTTTTYYAFNSEGYQLRMSYYEYSKEISIHLYAPQKLSEIVWPSTAIPKMLPVPESTYGRIEKDSSTAFRVYVGNMNPEQFAAYVQGCIDKGFTVDHDKTETRYKAKNKKGYSLTVEYEGFNVISIKVEAP